MQWLDSLRGLCALALLSLFGIVMMLVLDGAWDVLMFGLAASPIIIGALRAWRLNKAS